MKREICAMVTQGTLMEGESLLRNPDTSYLLSIAEHFRSLEVPGKGGVVIGLCVVDVSTSKFMVGQVCHTDDLRLTFSLKMQCKMITIFFVSR